MAKSTQQNILQLLTNITGRLANVESRLDVLERQLVNSDNFSESIDGYWEIEGADENLVASPVSRKPGRPPRTSYEERARRRDGMVQFLEVRWPNLATAMTKRSRLDALLQTLKNASRGAEHTAQYRHLTEHLATLWEFLHSGRYSGEPRQIAYAMAGLPEVTWRSSLDYYTAHPSPLPIHIRAHAEHIRRNQPKLFAGLRNDGATPSNIRLLKSCCADCRRLAQNPKLVNRTVNDGHAGIHISAR